MNLYLKHAAYISDVSKDLIKDIIMIGLFKSDPLTKLGTLMIPIKDIQDFLNSYSGLQEFLRARYRIIYNYLSRCISEINNKTPGDNDIQHVFFIKENPKDTF
jgi:hypothetical protein